MYKLYGKNENGEAIDVKIYENAYSCACNIYYDGHIPYIIGIENNKIFEKFNDTIFGDDGNDDDLFINELEKILINDGIITIDCAYNYCYEKTYFE